MKDKNLIISIFIIIFELLLYFFKSIISNNMILINFIFWLFLMILSYFFVGTLKYKKRTKVDSIQFIIIVNLLILFISYIFGVFRGFNSNSMNVINFIMLLSIIMMIEIVRYSLVKNFEKKYKFLISFLFIIPIILVFDFNLYMIIPITINSILLTYISYNVGVIPSIIHTIMFNIFNILPVKPNIDLFVNIFLLLIDNIFIYVLLNRLYKNDLRNLNIINKKQSKFIYLIIIVFVPYIMLMMGIGNYKMIGIVSDSMKPAFSRGAGVIFKKIDGTYYDKLLVGDILVYLKDDTYIVHRIVKKDNGLIITKGDNNDISDEIVYKEEYVGVVRAYIPLIGYPFVWLSE